MLLALASGAACPAVSDDSATVGATSGTTTGASTGEPTGGDAVCEEVLSWDLDTATVTVLAPDWTGDPGKFTRKISAPCVVQGKPATDAELALKCEDGAEMRSVSLAPNPQLQLVQGTAVQLEFLEDTSGLYPQSWLAVRGADGGVDLHFLSLHAGSLTPPVADFFAPLAFAEAGDCPQVVEGEDCYGTTAKRVDAQADAGPPVTLASAESGTATASFGAFAVKVVHAFRLDSFEPCDIQDPTGAYFDITAVFQFPPD